ncbi:MAG: cytidylate kinase-like family protein [Acidobacteriota bacterium]
MPIITISRGSHSLGHALAQKVATELGYPCVDREVVQEAAERLGVPQEVVRKRVDSAPSLWERLTSERKMYGAAMQSILADHAVQGDFVFNGYAGHLLFRGLHPILKVRIVAPMEVRIPLAMEAQGLDREAAAAYIARMDDDRARWTRFVYGVDWRDPSLYDVVLNVGLVSADSAAAAILALARRPEFSGPEPSPQARENFALQSRVRLALALNPASRSLEVSIHAEGGAVTISGDAPEVSMMPDIAGSFEREIRAIALDVPGVREVQLRFRPSPMPALY